MRTLFWLAMGCMIPGLLIRIPLGGAGILLSDLILPSFAAIFLLQKVIFERTWPKAYFFFPSFLFLIFALVSWLINAWQLDLKAQIISFSYIVRWVSLIIFGLAASELFGKNKSQCHPREGGDPGHQPKILNSRNNTWIPDQVRDDNGIAHSFFTGLYLILGIIIALGYLQFYIIPDIGRFSTAGGFDPHIGRFLGTWMDPNFVAGLLAFFVPLMLGSFYASWRNQLSVNGYQLSDDKTGNRSLTTGNCCWLLILILLSLLAIFLTFSRSGYLAAGLGIGLFFLFRDPKVILIGIVVIGLGIATNERAAQRTGELMGTFANVLFQETDEIDPTASLRIESWQKTFELYQRYPVFGIGYNTYRYIASDEGLVDENYFSSGGSDSSLITVLVTTGAFGCFAFLFWYFKIWFHHLRRFYKGKFTTHAISPHPYELHLGVWAGWSALLLHSFFVNSLLFPLILMPIMAVVGVLKD